MSKSLFYRCRHLGLIALIALFLGQAGLLAHKVTAEHAAGAGCELCTQFDNQSGAAVVVAAPAFVVAAVLCAVVPDAPFSPALKFFTYFLRGPPIL